ncbi:rhoGAP-domain-containing protein [Mucor ambiguus]|uniref:RhoGAP-domain-containing protein n=1 Tax=Mucor ambiguus TaxID=91626 RepID=A0A0C9MMJ7_9FUNG|nr:rhoGAP-domain-containing protein [Mucor ambiguus]
MQDNDWEVDINLGPESMHNIFRKRDILAYEPDKDLTLACERYQYSQNYLNDDLSSIAGSSVVSSRFSEMSLHHNIDDFMFDDPVTPPQLQPNEMTIKQQQNLPGVVKKLGLRYQNIAEETDDWDDDVEIPSKGISLSLSQRQEYEQQIDFDSDIGPSVSERVARFPKPPTSVASSAAPKFRYEIEQDDDQDDMAGLDFPVNMATLPVRLDERKKGINVPSNPASTTKPTIYKSKIPTSSPKSKLLASMREKDDEDFTEGLRINERNFHIDGSGRSSTSSLQQPRSLISTKGKSPASLATASRLARPSIATKSRIPELPKRQPLISQQSSSPHISTRRNLLASTQSSLNREVVSTEVKQRQQQRPTLNRSLLTNKEPVERKSANGYTLISRPKTYKGGYCSQLDNIDNLNDLRPKFSRQIKKENNNSNRNGADSQRPWRRNMQQPQKKANVRLIKPNEQPVKSKYNEMEFDPVAQNWKGNEKSLADFQEKAYRGPMLMTQIQQKNPSRYAALKGNNMIFIAEEQKWVSALGPQQEFNELDVIEDLVDDTPVQHRRNMINNKPSGVFGVEFKLTVETKRQMMFDQEKHESFFQNWPLMKEPLINRSGYRVDMFAEGANVQPNDLINQMAELEGGLHALLEKVKGDSQMTKDISTFLKKRAFLEESYGRDMVKVAQATAEAFDKAHPKSGTFGDVWISMLKVHENIGNQRIKFAATISDSAEDLLSVGRSIEKERKKIKDAGMHYEKLVTDADLQLEKSKQKFESTNEEWGRAVSQRNQEPTQTPKKNLFRSSRTPAQLDRTENDCRNKMDAADAQYKIQQKKTIQTHAEYYELHLPKVLKELKAVDDECHVALRYQLANYAYTFEQALTEDGLALDNDQGTGLRGLIKKIRNDADWVEFVRLCTERSGRIQKNELVQQENALPANANFSNNRVFGVSLEQQAEMSEDMVPDILKQCATVVEQYALSSVGIYRLSGTSSRIQKIKFKFESGDPNPISEEDLSDINNVTSVLKLWFRELPDPLFPSASYHQFLEAAKLPDDRNRVIGLHTVINDLSDAHYATLKYLMCHLHKVQSYQRFNKMGAANLATIFGLTLMSSEAGSQSQMAVHDNQRIAESQLQAKVVQTILENYSEIFEEE